MPNKKLRRALQAHTAPTHQLLDDAVGSFVTAEAYGRFVASSLAFRDPIEARFAGYAQWPLLPLADLMRADLADLKLVPRPERRFTVASHGPAALGVAYVVEGSALGARLLVRRAAALGFEPHRGARHLTAQTRDPMRWSRFLALLETVPDSEADAVLEAAAATFDFALGIYAAESV